MKVFLCSYSGFSLAIPMDFVSSIFLFKDNMEKAIEYNTENRNTYISLPMIFNCPSLKVRHGVVLKTQDNNDVIEDKIILLTTEIEGEEEIQQDTYYPIPKSLEIMQFSHFFGGIFFKSRQNRETSVSGILAEALGLLLNTEPLLQNLQKEILL